MKINGFEQIKAFYSWVFENPDKARPTHISLYLFLWNQNNRANWVEWFKCPYDLAMQGACIGSKSTYYKSLDQLSEWNLIEYKKGVNNFKAPQIKLIQLYKSGQVTVPLSEQVTVQPSVPLSGNIYKLITDNIELIESNLEKWIKLELEKPVIDNTFESVKEFLKWFNGGKNHYTGVEGKTKDLKGTDLTNFKYLNKTYTRKDFSHALKMMSKSEWVKENKMFTPQHFLRENNFTKYLNQEDSKQKVVVDPNEYFKSYFESKK